MTPAASSSTSLGAAFSPLSALLRAEDADKLNSIIRAVAKCDRFELVDRLAQSMSRGKRVQAYVLNAALTAKGIPPVFRYPDFYPSADDVNHKNDLFMYDMQWLERTCGSHVKKIRFARYRDMFTPILTRFCNATDYVFYEGRRPAWRIVASLALEEDMQHDCMWLRSEPVKKKHEFISHYEGAVKRALEADLARVTRSSIFTEDDAKNSLERRFALWVCSQMTHGKPTATAKRYEQMTGLSMNRHVAFSQLKKIKLATKKISLRP
ncbi:hypothetical protein ACO0K7_10150 [Undibacterium sp. Ji67W]|uniref:hypothetical protein n=1 Tax=Undibacterium sp. Ji67W TaxID=3413042 RepID=UPI003BF291DD